MNAEALVVYTLCWQCLHRELSNLSFDSASAVLSLLSWLLRHMGHHISPAVSPACASQQLAKGTSHFELIRSRIKSEFLLLHVMQVEHRTQRCLPLVAPMKLYCSNTVNNTNKTVTAHDYQLTSPFVSSFRSRIVLTVPQMPSTVVSLFPMRKEATLLSALFVMRNEFALSVAASGGFARVWHIRRLVLTQSYTRIMTTSLQTHCRRNELLDFLVTAADNNARSMLYRLISVSRKIVSRVSLRALSYIHPCQWELMARAQCLCECASVGGMMSAKPRAAVTIDVLPKRHLTSITASASVDERWGVRVVIVAASSQEDDCLAAWLVYVNPSSVRGHMSGQLHLSGLKFAMGLPQRLNHVDTMSVAEVATIHATSLNLHLLASLITSLQIDPWHVKAMSSHVSSRLQLCYRLISVGSRVPLQLKCCMLFFGRASLFYGVDPSTRTPVVLPERCCALVASGSTHRNTCCALGLVLCGRIPGPFLSTTSSVLALLTLRMALEHVQCFCVAHGNCECLPCYTCAVLRPTLQPANLAVTQPDRVSDAPECQRFANMVPGLLIPLVQQSNLAHTSLLHSRAYFRYSRGPHLLCISASAVNVDVQLSVLFLRSHQHPPFCARQFD